MKDLTTNQFLENHRGATTGIGHGNSALGIKKNNTGNKKLFLDPTKKHT